MSAQVFLAIFYSTQRPSQIGPTADFDGAAIPPPIFSMVVGVTGNVNGMQIFPFNSKGIPSQMSTVGR